MLPQLAQGDANKVFVIPSEFAEAFGGIGKAFAGARPDAATHRRRPASRVRAQLAGPRRAARRDRRSLSRRLQMFDSLAEKLQATLADVRGRGTLTEADINAAMREIRLALLEADVNFKVVKSFTDAVKERALGADMIGKLNPGQQVVKIVSDELTELMGGAAARAVVLAAPADGDPDGRAAGLGQDDRHRQARALPARAARLLGRRRRLRRLPAGRRRAADQGRRAGRRRRLRAGHRPRPGQDRRLGARPRPDRGQGRADRRHQRPPARRRGADEGARRHQEGGQARTTSCSSSTR